MGVRLVKETSDKEVRRVWMEDLTRKEHEGFHVIYEIFLLKGKYMLRFNCR